MKTTYYQALIAVDQESGICPHDYQMAEVIEQMVAVRLPGKDIRVRASVVNVTAKVNYLTEPRKER
jgi:hypothetical protein